MAAAGPGNSSDGRRHFYATSSNKHPDARTSSGYPLLQPNKLWWYPEAVSVPLAEPEEATATPRAIKDLTGLRLDVLVCTTKELDRFKVKWDRERTFYQGFRFYENDLNVVDLAIDSCGRDHLNQQRDGCDGRSFRLQFLLRHDYAPDRQIPKKERTLMKLSPTERSRRFLQGVSGSLGCFLAALLREYMEDFRPHQRVTILQLFVWCDTGRDASLAAGTWICDIFHYMGGHAFLFVPDLSKSLGEYKRRLCPCEECNQVQQYVLPAELKMARNLMSSELSRVTKGELNVWSFITPNDGELCSLCHLSDVKHWTRWSG